MLTVIIEVVLGVFISNLKAKEHPYLFCFIKGFLLGLIGFLLPIIYYFFYENYLMSSKDLFFFFLLTQVIGISVSLLFLCIEYLFPDKEDDSF